jgi:hypothetical protein
MSISFTQVLIWILIAAVVGVVGELLARRRAPDGILGAIIIQPHYARYYRRGSYTRRPRRRRLF